MWFSDCFHWEDRLDQDIPFPAGMDYGYPKQKTEIEPDSRNDFDGNKSDSRRKADWPALIGSLGLSYCRLPAASTPNMNQDCRIQ